MEVLWLSKTVLAGRVVFGEVISFNILSTFPVDPNIFHEYSVFRPVKIYINALEAFCCIVEVRNSEAVLLSGFIRVGPFEWPNSSNVTLTGHVVLSLW